MADNEITGMQSPTAPYASFEQVCGLISYFNQKGFTPSHIDDEVVAHIPRSSRAQLITSLKSLLLIEQNRMSTQAFKDLVSSYRTNKWRGELRDAVKRAYAAVFTDGSIDLATIPASRLHTTFEEKYRCTGDATRKAVTLFTRLAREAGLSVSPLAHPERRASRIAPAVRRASSPRREARSATAAPGAVQAITDGHVLLLCERHAERLPTFDPTWLETQQARWHESYNKLTDLLAAHAVPRERQHQSPLIGE